MPVAKGLSALPGHQEALFGSAGTFGDQCVTSGPSRKQPSFEVILSVVVPCFDEEPNLAELHSRLSAVCHAVAGQSYELVLVNDGSRDGTWQMIERLAQRDRQIIGVNLSRNHGHQLALSAGLTVCSGARVLIIDADLQDPPDLLPRMMQLMDQGADVVYGQRVERAGETWFKRTSASLFYRLFNRMVGVPIPRDTGDFRLISRRALHVLNAMPERDRFVRGMVSWIGLRQVALPYHRQPRFAGETKYPIHKMVGFAINAITSFSYVPLRVASYLGVLIGGLGIVVLLYTLWSWLAGSTVPGWASVMSVLLVVSSAQLIVLGIFGEYIGRIFMEVKRRPLFVIDQIVSGADCRRHPAEDPALRDAAFRG